MAFAQSSPIFTTQFLSGMRVSRICVCHANQACDTLVGTVRRQWIAIQECKKMISEVANLNGRVYPQRIQLAIWVSLTGFSLNFESGNRTLLPTR